MYKVKNEAHRKSAKIIKSDMIDRVKETLVDALLIQHSSVKTRSINEDGPVKDYNFQAATLAALALINIGYLKPATDNHLAHTVAYYIEFSSIKNLYRHALELLCRYSVTELEDMLSSLEQIMNNNIPEVVKKLQRF